MTITLPTPPELVLRFWFTEGGGVRTHEPRGWGRTRSAARKTRTSRRESMKIGLVSFGFGMGFGLGFLSGLPERYDIGGSRLPLYVALNPKPGCC